MSSLRRTPVLSWKRLGIALATSALPWAFSSSTVHAAPPSADEISAVARVGATNPSLVNPLRLAVAASERNFGLLWSGQSLHLSRTKTELFGLVGTRGHSPAVFDPSSSSWFAAAYGSLVRVQSDGSLPVILDDIQGLDIDVRASSQTVVSREPNDSIVYRRWGSSPERAVLAQGQAFFAPRLSADGHRVVISESRTGGGHVWLSTLPHPAVDISQGNDPVFHPDGRRLFFVRIQGDGHSIVSSDIWVRDLEKNTEARLAITPLAEIEPTISADGRYIAFRDALTRDTYIAVLDEGR